MHYICEDGSTRRQLPHHAQLLIAAGGTTPGQVWVHADAQDVGPHLGGDLDLNGIAGVGGVVTLHHESYVQMMPEPLKRYKESAAGLMGADGPWAHADSDRLMQAILFPPQADVATRIVVFVLEYEYLHGNYDVLTVTARSKVAEIEPAVPTKASSSSCKPKPDAAGDASESDRDASFAAKFAAKASKIQSKSKSGQAQRSKTCSGKSRTWSWTTGTAANMKSVNSILDEDILEVMDQMSDPSRHNIDLDSIPIDAGLVDPVPSEGNDLSYSAVLEHALGMEHVELQNFLPEEDDGELHQRHNDEAPRNFSDSEDSEASCPPIATAIGGMVDFDAEAYCLENGLFLQSMPTLLHDEIWKINELESGQELAAIYPFNTRSSIRTLRATCKLGHHTTTSEGKKRPRSCWLVAVCR